MSSGRRLGEVEWIVAAICIVFPFRMLLAALAPVDLHLGALSFALLVALVFLRTRSLPPGFPAALDLAIAGFAAVAVIDLFWLGDGPSARSLKGFTVELRFVAIWFLARALGLGRAFSRWLLVATLVIGTAAAFLGLTEYHLRWGTLLELLDLPGDRRYWKTGIPRLYSFPMVPLSAAYLFLLALCAAAYRAMRGASTAASLVVLLLLWQALPLTLSRSALSVGILLTAAFALFGGVAGRRFAALSLAAFLAGIAVFSARGWGRPLARYAEVGGTLSDRSAEVHSELLHGGIGLVSERPLGYGFAEAGHVAMESGGVFPWNETQYVTVAIQMGVQGVIAFLFVVALVLYLWWREVTAEDPERRAIGIAGFGMGVALALGGLFHATWSMIVPQLYFWLLSAAAANGARGDDR